MIQWSHDLVSVRLQVSATTEDPSEVSGGGREGEREEGERERERGGRTMEGGGRGESNGGRRERAMEGGGREQ